MIPKCQIVRRPFFRPPRVKILDLFRDLPQPILVTFAKLLDVLANALELDLVRVLQLVDACGSRLSFMSLSLAIVASSSATGSC